MQKIIINALLFQIQWFICVQGNNALAAASFACLLFVHNKIIKPHNYEWYLIITFSVVGFIIESIVGSFGFINYQGHYVLGDSNIIMAPLWLCIMWAAFASTFCHSLKWLQGKIAICALLAFLVVPVNYYLGVKISSSEFPKLMISGLLVQAVIWIILLPIALYFASQISKKIDA